MSKCECGDEQPLSKASFLTCRDPPLEYMWKVCAHTIMSVVPSRSFTLNEHLNLDVVFLSKNFPTVVYASESRTTVFQ